MSKITNFLDSMVDLRPNAIDTMDRFIIKHAREFDSIQLVDTECTLINVDTWRHHQPKECFGNAQSVAWAFRHRDRSEDVNIKYVEGYVFVPDAIIPVYHAWIAVNGKVFDTTLKVFGTIPEGWEYFGVEMILDAVDHAIIHHEAHTPLIDDYQCKWPMLQK